MAAALARLGVGAQAQLGDQPQGSPAAGKQAHQVVASHGFNHLAARPGGGAIGPQQGQADHLVAHAQVALAQASGHAPGHQAANAAGTLAIGAAAPGPVQCQPLARFGQGRLQVPQGHARLHGHREITDGMLQQPIESAATHHRGACRHRGAPVQATALAGR